MNAALTADAAVAGEPSASPYRAEGGVDNRSLRRADPRFLLPVSPRTVAVFPGAEAWGDAVDHLGLRASIGGEPPALVVAPANAASQAARMRAPMVVLEGTRGWRALEAAGYSTSRWMPFPSLEAPRAMVPIGQPNVARYAVRSWAASDRIWKRARNLAAGTLLGQGAFTDVRRTVTVGLRTQAPPFLLTAARDLGLPPDARFLLNLGGADMLSRSAVQVFPKGSTSPAWVLKFSRIRGHARPFVDDERGLGLIAGAGDEAARQAPRLLGRFEVDGYHASVETAAVGRPLDQFLGSSRPRHTKVAMVNRIAGERRRLSEEVLPHWDVAIEPLAGVADVPAVLQHNDLGCWNMVVDAGDFRAIDWESALAHGFPLWDLFYFLTDALALVDGAGEAEWDRYVPRLYRGELASSAILFAWTRRLVATLGIPSHAVGPLATLCWMHHGVSHLHRQGVGNRSQADVSLLPRAERVAPLWLSDPALGAGWDRWRA